MDFVAGKWLELCLRQAQEKLALLKRLEFEVSPGPISETALELMERLAEAERGNEVVSDAAMRRAYCAVSVECMLRRMRIGGRGRELEFFAYELSKMVERVRRGRMGLGSELLSEWEEMGETEVWDDDVCESVLKRFERVSAAESVMIYVRSEVDKMGPSFIDVVVKNMRNEELHKLIDNGVGLRHPSTAAKIVNSDETVGGPSTCRVHTPKRIIISPLRTHKMRRRVRRWSTPEEDALTEGVEKYGEGCWKVILTDDPSIFDGRTEVDLKDKWRNMIKRDKKQKQKQKGV